MSDTAVNLLLAVCQPQGQGNPVAWYRLERMHPGITDHLKTVCLGPNWQGQKPDFSSVPTGDLLAAIKATEGTSQ